MIFLLGISTQKFPLSLGDQAPQSNIFQLASKLECDKPENQGLGHHMTCIEFSYHWCIRKHSQYSSAQWSICSAGSLVVKSPVILANIVICQKSIVFCNAMLLPLCST